MPSLSPEDRKALLGPIGERCPECSTIPVRHYCRSCDEFVTHCACPFAIGDAWGNHLTHRVYLWTKDAVLAIPHFDPN